MPGHAVHVGRVDAVEVDRVRVAEPLPKLIRSRSPSLAPQGRARDRGR